MIRKSLWNESSRREIFGRLDRLHPRKAPAWGRLTAPQMVAHLADSMRMALGEMDVKGRHTLFRYSPIKQLLIYALPFPKSAPTARELLSTKPDHWDDDIERVKELVERVIATSDRKTWGEHPLFGRLSARTWGVLGYRHFDHHLKQFGV